MHAGSFCVSVIHPTLTWTTGSLTCVRDHSCVHVYTWGLGTLTAIQHSIFDSEKFTFFFFLCSWQDSNLGPLDLQSNALPIEPPHTCSIGGSFFVKLQANVHVNPPPRIYSIFFSLWNCKEMSMSPPTPPVAIYSIFLKSILEVLQDTAFR